MEMTVARQLSSATWRETLEREAPWWTKMGDAAITRLGAPVPESHVKRELTESRLSWDSGDPLLNALQLLDDILAIDPASPFETLQDRMVDAIASKWREWPPFTKASVLSCLRRWFWHTFPALRCLLAESVESEPHAVVVRYAVDRLVDLAWAAPTPELPTFMRRAAAGGHGDALRCVSRVLGAAAVRTSLLAQGSRVKELDEYFRQALALDWSDAAALTDFLHGALVGATDCFRGAGLKTAELEEAWLRVTDLVVARWPFGALNEAHGGRFSVHALLSVIEGDTSPEARGRLFLGLSPALEMILRNGDLGAYCELHFELKGLIAGKDWRARGRRESRDSVPISEPLEAVLLGVCRASVERVAVWKREGKTTNDLGWTSGLDGRDSTELVKCCLDVSRDRERMKRELMPLTDILADAGETGVAAELRAYLRKA
ncbi:MAG: hypothetical protein WD847_09030 [Pirellulales bacterium]